MSSGLLRSLPYHFATLLRRTYSPCTPLSRLPQGVLFADKYNENSQKGQSCNPHQNGKPFVQTYPDSGNVGHAACQYRIHLTPPPGPAAAGIWMAQCRKHSEDLPGCGKAAAADIPQSFWPAPALSPAVRSVLPHLPGSSSLCLQQPVAEALNRLLLQD